MLALFLVFFAICAASSNDQRRDVEDLCSLAFEDEEAAAAAYADYAPASPHELLRITFKLRSCVTKGRLYRDEVRRLGDAELQNPASWWNHRAFVLLAKAERQDSGTIDHQGYSLLHLAVALRMPNIVELLLSLGAKPDARASNSETALHTAHRMRSTKIIAALTKAGANTVARDASGRSAAELLRAHPRSESDCTAHEPAIDVETGGWRDSNRALDMPALCDIPVLDARITSAEVVHRDFVSTGTPLLLRGGVLNSSWPARSEWQRASLMEKAPGLKLLVGQIPYSEYFGLPSNSVALRTFLRYLDDLAARLQPTMPADPSPPFYVFDGEVLRNAASPLSEDVQIPRGFEHLAESYPVYPQLSIGPAGSGAPFHRHCDAVNGLVFGRKRWRLLPPEHAFYTREHPSTTQDEAIEGALDCVQRAGDVLFVPMAWGHSVLNEAESVAAAFEFDRGDC